MKKKPSFKNQIEFKGVRSFVEFLKRRKQNFTIISTGYTKRITWKGEEFSFVNDESSNVVFACYNKIKADIKNSGEVIDSVPRFNVEYFSVNRYLQNAGLTLPGEVLNVDINSAYLSVLLKYKMITKETFDYVSKFDRMIRHKSIGMLGMQKLNMTFIEGVLQPVKKEDLIFDEELRNVYFFVCYKVGEVMTLIADMYGNDFLFFWVDGIYLEPHVRGEKVIETLNANGYEAKFKTLFDCTFTIKKNLLYFAHLDESKPDKSKRFVIPFRDEENRKKLNAYINGLKRKSIKPLTINENELHTVGN